MRLARSLQKETTNLFFRKLIQRVRGKKIRPFCIDEQGLWFKTEYGFDVYSNLKDRILELDVNPVWEQMESSFIVHNLKEADVFIDVGANIGYFSMLAAQQRAGRVLAIEPSPETYNMLNMNIKHNMFTDVIETFNVALGNKKHTAKLVASLGPKSHLEYMVDNIHARLPTITVNVTTLDDLLKTKTGVEKVDLIKVDIEGAEYDFLRGASETIKAFKPMILMEIEEHRLVKYNATAGNVFEFMAHLGYKYLLVTEDLITDGNVYEEDLKKARNFVFYACCHHPVY